MNLSVLIPIGGRLSTDPTRNRALNWLRARYEALLPGCEIAFGTSTQEPYNRAQARNRAFAASTGDILLVADADTIFHGPQIAGAVNLVRGGTPWVIPYGDERYYNLTQQETDLVLMSPCNSTIPEPRDPDQWEHKITSWAGLLVLSREAWLKVGGYDEAFIGWGYEDNAFRAALDNRVGQHRRVDSYVLHLWHPVTTEERFEQPAIVANRELCRRYEAGELP